MTSPIISISGIRGIPGVSLIPVDISRYISAFVQHAGGGPIVVGKDGRPSGNVIADLVSAIARMCGADVIDLGMAPTPTVQLAVEHYSAAGGIAITASHNPQQWNGLKFLNKRGIFLDAVENAAWKAIVDRNEQVWSAWDAMGTLTMQTDFWRLHVEAVLAHLPEAAARIRARRFKIVVDAVNASGSEAVPALLAALGCEVIRLHCDGSGLFPHTPEPLPQNLRGLGEAVRNHNADLGIAVDPDADRLVLFSETGEPYGEEYTITTAVASALSRHAVSRPADVVVNLSTTRAVEDIARERGARLHRTPVGEINVVNRMLELQALIGGEGSGGVILPAIHPGRDSLVGILLVLEAFSAFDGTVSQYRAQLPQYEIQKFKYSTAELDPAAVLARAAEVYAERQPNTDDGLRIDFVDGWVHLRVSNTEPIMRVIAEARSATDAARLAAEVAAAAGLA